MIDTTEGAALNINDSISSVNLLLTGDGNVANFTDVGEIATIDAEVLTDIELGREALEAASEMTEESQLEVAE